MPYLKEDSVNCLHKFLDNLMGSKNGLVLSYKDIQIPLIYIFALGIFSPHCFRSCSDAVKNHFRPSENFFNKAFYTNSLPLFISSHKMVQENLVDAPVDDVNLPVDPPPFLCQCRTHTSLAVIKMLKTLSLASVLQMNKKMEAKNDARALRTLEHEQDPVAHPVASSEMASLITIEAENLN